MNNNQSRIYYYVEDIGFGRYSPNSTMEDPYELYRCHFNSKKTSHNGFFVPRNSKIFDIIVFYISYNSDKYNLYLQKNLKSGKSRFIFLYKNPILQSDYAKENQLILKMIPEIYKNQRIMKTNVIMNIGDVNITPFKVSDLCNINFTRDAIFKLIIDELKKKI